MYQTIAKAYYTGALLVALLIFPVLLAGCSNSPSGPDAGSGVYATRASEGPSISLGHFRMSFDEDAGTVAVEAIRPDVEGRYGQIDVTDYVDFGVTGAKWDPVTRDWTIDAFIKNPTYLTGYGVWVVFTNLGNKVLKGQDGFTWIEQPGGGMLRCPFTAVCKKQQLRKFPPYHVENLTLVIHWPAGVNSWPPVEFFIDASWPKERKTPMVEDLSSWHTVGSSPDYYITAWVADFQEASGELTVFADLTPIGGGGYNQMYDDGLHGDGGQDDSTFGCVFKSTAAGGDYTITVHACDPKDHWMENDVALAVVPPNPDPCVDWWELRKGVKCNIDWDDEFLIKSQDEFDLFIQQLGTWPNPPQIDWTKEMVLAFTWGEVMSSGYWFQMIDACKDKNDVMHIRFIRWWPGPNCIVAWVIQRPYYVVKAERYDGEIVFDGQFKPDPCKY